MKLNVFLLNNLGYWFYFFAAVSIREKQMFLVSIFKNILSHLFSLSFHHIFSFFFVSISPEWFMCVFTRTFLWERRVF